jgi:hypothetical protein
VPKITTEPRFRAHFEQFGPVSHVELNAMRSFGFVTFLEEASAERALHTRMHAFGTAFIEVRRPAPKRGGPR